MPTVFEKLSNGWNADPNAPLPAVGLDKDHCWLRFAPNTWNNPSELSQGALYLQFQDCHRFRFLPINDESWYKGQCRFSKLAPAWGEFFSVTGNLLEEQEKTPWITVGHRPTCANHYLFYFRDELFECTASSWELKTEKPDGLAFEGPVYHVQ
ncbi:hypothetical protein RUE5091_00527 [Ruegeria denitrificans]|uniref:Uncharacterized protein n=1 Tax=Ruegeria denitrificans TaxID=1715692 RepID=A0A0P1I2X5_9RHOB|nr:hypothetical protein [Ruegeria denitrificans]CUJ86892.1 hypothetical protein RUE5091_00527 [Ruegeria denitrificans]